MWNDIVWYLVRTALMVTGPLSFHLFVPRRHFSRINPLLMIWYKVSSSFYLRQEDFEWILLFLTNWPNNYYNLYSILVLKVSWPVFVFWFVFNSSQSSVSSFWITWHHQHFFNLSKLSTQRFSHKFISNRNFTTTTAKLKRLIE